MAILRNDEDFVAYVSARLRRDKDVALAIATHGSSEIVASFFFDRGDLFRDDKGIVLAILRKHVNFFQQVSARLQEDKDVLIAAMNPHTALGVLRSVPATIQERYPEVPIHAIQTVVQSHAAFIGQYVQPPTLFTSKPMAIAWIRRGNGWMDAFSDLLNDAEFALELASNTSDFRRVHESLHGSLDFMMEVVDRNGSLVRNASVDLRSNYALLTRAVARNRHALGRHGRVDTEQLMGYVDNKLDLHKAFTEVLRGFGICQQWLPPPQRSPLSLLEIGMETTQSFKRLIAEFAGVPPRDFEWRKPI